MRADMGAGLFEMGAKGNADGEDTIDVHPPAANTAEQDQAVTACRRWFDLDKNAKEFYRLEMDENDKLYNGRHWDLIGPHGGPLRTPEQQRTRPNCVENVVFSLVEGLTAEFANDIDLVFFPVEQSDKDVATTMTELTQFIAYKNRIGIERIKWLRNFFKHGTAVWEHVWDPYWRGGKGGNRWEGEVRWRSIHPRNFFPDARCGESLEGARRVQKARYVTLEYIRERYPTYGHLVSEEALDVALLPGEIIEETGSIPEAQQEQVLLVETWYIGEPMLLPPGEKSQGPGLHVIWWAGEARPVFLHMANYVYFDPGEEARFPFTVRQRYQRDGYIWGYGEPFFLKAPQIAMNKTSELILEGHMHHAVGMTLYQSGALTPEQRRHVQEYGTIPGTWHEVADIGGVKREFGSGVSASLPNEMNRLQHAMESIVGRYDVSQGRTPGSVTAFRALDLLSQRAQVRLRAADVAITTAYEDVGRYICTLISRNYTEERAYRIVGADKQQNPVQKHGVFKLQDMLRAYDFNNGQTMPLSQFLPLPGMVEGQDYEVFSPDLDAQARTSTQMPSDRTFYMEMAKELYMQQLIDPETFFYVVEHGVFPPIDELVQKMQEQAAGRQSAAMGGAPGGASVPGASPMPPTPSPGALPPELAALAPQMPQDMMVKLLRSNAQAVRLGNLSGGSMA